MRGLQKKKPHAEPLAMPAPPGLTAKEKRKYMAKQFEVTQHAMSSTVDELSLSLSFEQRQEAGAS